MIRWLTNPGKASASALMFSAIVAFIVAVAAGVQGIGGWTVGYVLCAVGLAVAGAQLARWYTAWTAARNAVRR